jgi:soluble lytic murein transglycosylase
MMGMNPSGTEGRRTGSLGVKQIAFLVVTMGFFWISVPPSARGDIYWYQDESGVIHMSNVPVDERFRFKEREKGNPKPKILPRKGGKRYDKLIEKVARAEGLDSDLIRAVVETESNYDPWAVSKKGAVGLMQLMPETAKRMGVTDPFHPAENLEAGTRYLKRLIDKYEGQLTLALSAYNAGERAVDRYRGIPPFPETQDYVTKVLNAYDRASRKRKAVRDTTRKHGS